MSIPEIEIPFEQLREGVPVVDLLVSVGATKSKREARTLISQGGITLFSDTPFPLRVEDPKKLLTEVDIPKFIDVEIEDKKARIWIGG